MLEITQSKGLAKRSAKASPRLGDAPRSRAAEVAGLLLEVVPGTMRELRREARQCKIGNLTMPQFRILAHIGCEPSNNKSLAEAVGVSVAASSRMVDLLVKRGLVERAPSAGGDRRQVELRLTAEGNRQYEGMRRQVRNRLRQRFAAISPAELDRLELGLRALRDSFSG